MSQGRTRTPTPLAAYSTIEFIPGRIDSPEDFSRPSVHVESTVAERSPYLYAKIHSTKPDEPPSSTTKLSSADPTAFQVYVGWLDSERIDFPPSRLACVEPQSLSWRQCEVLIKAHMLGSQFEDSKFQDQVMNELFRWLKPEPGFDRRICDLVFGQQASGVSQQFKCLVVDRMFEEEGLGDEMLSFFLKRKIGGKVGNTRPGECEYHVHGQAQCGQHTEVTGANHREDVAQVSSPRLFGAPRQNSVMVDQRRRSTRKSVADPWNFSSCLRIMRKLESIDVDDRAYLQPQNDQSLPPPPQIHPFLLNSVDVAPPETSRPPSRRQDSLFLPPTAPASYSKFDPSALKGLSPNDCLLAEMLQPTRPFTVTGASPHGKQWPVRPPTPFRLINRQPTACETETRSNTPKAYDKGEVWPLRNPRPSSAPLTRRSQPATPIPPLPFPPARYYESASPVSCPLPERPRSQASSNGFRRKALPPLPPLPSLPSFSRSRTKAKFMRSLSTTPERPLPPLPSAHMDENWPLRSLTPDSEGTITYALRRKPAPGNGLEFLARYIEGEKLILRATRTQNDEDGSIGSSVGHATDKALRPVELQGRTVRFSELWREDKRRGTA